MKDEYRVPAVLRVQQFRIPEHSEPEADAAVWNGSNVASGEVKQGSLPKLAAIASEQLCGLAKVSLFRFPQCEYLCPSAHGRAQDPLRHCHSPD